MVVTVNHGLASFGYLQLADLGAPGEFAFAGVTGVMDMTASLEWIRDNISNFGGDPANVFIFGQSGGGIKMPTGKIPRRLLSPQEAWGTTPAPHQ